MRYSEVLKNKKSSDFNCYEHETINDTKKSIFEKHSNPIYLIENEAYKIMVETYFSKRNLILDAGGGWGRHALYLQELGYKVFLIDSSRTQLRGAKFYLERIHRKQGIRVIQGRIDCQSPFKFNSFENIICFGAILSCADYESILYELSKLLKNNGLLIASVLCKDAILREFLKSKHTQRDLNLLVKYGIIQCPKAKKKHLVRCFLKSFGNKELQEFISKFNLEIIDIIKLSEIVLNRIGRKKMLIILKNNESFSKFFKSSPAYSRYIKEELRRVLFHKYIVIAKKKSVDFNNRSICNLPH